VEAGPTQAKQAREQAAVDRLRAVAAYACAAISAAVAAVLLLRLWDADLHVPFDHRGDALFFGMLVKSIGDNGWYLTNPYAGAPGVLAMHDFPLADAFHLALIKGMTLLTSDWAVVFNLYFLLGFPLIAVTALAVFRHFRVGYGPALAGSLLYAFFPSRVLKGESHLFLDVFFQVPLALLVVLWVCGETPPLVRDRKRRWPGLDLGHPRALAALGICVLTSATGAYYAFFTAALLLLAGLLTSVERRTLTNAVAALTLAGTIVLGMGLQGLPTLFYQLRHGPNPQVAARHPHEAEVQGLRITQLLLPVRGHRLPPLRELKERYDASSGPRLGESSSTALGILGSLGFLALFGRLLMRPRRERARTELWRSLARLNLLAVLLAVSAGLGSLFALLVTPTIRVYSRMSVLIGFLALFAVVLLIEHFSAGSRRRTAVLTGALLCVGLLDQVTPAAVRPYAAVAAEYRGDERFVRAVEAAVPAAGAMMFTLPYLRFPEAEQIPERRLVDYDPLRLYLHSRTLRWSYPAMANRSADGWAGNVAGLGPPEMLRTLADAGFAGLVLDRAGYRDGGAALVAEIRAELGAGAGAGAARSSEDGRLLFFDLGPHNQRLHAGLGAAERARRRDLALHSVYLRWMEGFFAPEQGPSGTFRWSTGRATIEVDNPSDGPRLAAISMNLSAAQPPASLRIDGDLLSEEVALPPAGAAFSHTLMVPPGRHFIHLRCDGKPALAPRDPRRLVFRVDTPLVINPPDR
jgi:phosphoglycerol transferase